MERIRIVLCRPSHPGNIGAAARAMKAMGLSAWDMAAGALLIQEAGGLVGDLAGEANYLDSGDIAAATPKVFPELLRSLA